MPGDNAAFRPRTDVKTSARMSRQARKNTVAELSLRRQLHRLGLRYRVEYPVPGKPRRRMDVAFTRAKVAVYVDGCFWHACPQHGTNPATNDAWWAEKLRQNIDRDRETDAHLACLGWTVIRVWEHEDAEAAASRVMLAVRSLVRGRPSEGVAGPAPTWCTEGR